MVFPGITQVFHNERSENAFGRKISSSLTLQMSLYFNGFLFPFWLVGIVLILSVKYSHLSELYRIVLVTILIVITIIEVIRIFLGYLGNLTEKVPELAGFWLLTCLLQFPLLLFLLLNEDTKILPFERALNIVMMTFVVFEIIFGYFAIKVLTTEQVAKFQMNFERSAEDSSSSHPHTD
ncbi:Transmembrane protein 17B [Nymphon striatum]|nr:Transmembrane protein 17B [Nymphon striatum]